MLVLLFILNHKEEMLSICVYYCVINLEENKRCEEKLIIKGIRDAGSIADFRILFEVLKFKNLEI